MGLAGVRAEAVKTGERIRVPDEAPKARPTHDSLNLQICREMHGAVDEGIEMDIR